MPRLPCPSWISVPDPVTTAAPPPARPHDAALPTLAMLLRGDADGLRAAGGPDWPACATLAMRHGLGPLLYDRGRRMADAWPMPPAVERELRTSWMGATLENRGVLAAAGEAIGRLADAGIRVAALKGLHLAAAVYDNPALRKMTDVDLLVPPDQVDAARAVLLEAGYESDGADDPTIHHVAPLVKARAAPIELHRDLSATRNPFRLEVAPMWARMVPISVDGHPALGLGTEDLLIHLCVHAVYGHRCLVPLRNIFDVVMVVERSGPALRWEALEAAARETRTERALFCGLSLAREMFGAAIPGGVLERLVPDGGADAVLRTARENVLGFESAGPVWLGRTLGEGQASRSVRGFLRYVFAPPDRLLETSGRTVGMGGLAWIYLTRPFKLLVRHRGRLMDIARGRPGAREQLRLARAGAELDAWIRGGGR
jgi:hypothetical protein